MKKIIVIGSPGSGKSTFSKLLAKHTGIKLHHLDMIWHKSDKTNITREEFDCKLSEIMQGDSWIIDGNYQRTIEMRLKNCDTVFLLAFPPDVCLSGALERVGKKRDDMPWTEDELDSEFRQWIIDFPKDALPKIYALLENYGDKNIIIFKSRDEANNYIARFGEEK